MTQPAEGYLTTAPNPPNPPNLPSTASGSSKSDGLSHLRTNVFYTYVADSNGLLQLAQVNMEVVALADPQTGTPITLQDLTQIQEETNLLLRALIRVCCDAFDLDVPPEVADEGDDDSL